MIKTLALALLSACATAPALAPIAQPRNAPDVLLAAGTPDNPHGPVGAKIALTIIPDAKVLLACYSTDGVHTVCFDPVQEYVNRKDAEAQKKQAEAKAKADAEAAEKPKAAEAPKKK